MNKTAFKNSSKNCTNRNALLARQNRMKKKQYIESLEKEITRLKTSKMKLNSIVTNQSAVISELCKEVKYMKSILANSSDLSNLIKSIHTNTGMSVSTSLDKTVIMNNCISKQNVKEETKHPWEDLDYTESADLDLGFEGTSPFWEHNLDNFLLNDMPTLPPVTAALDEHNYTSKLTSDILDEEMPGVCLHVNKHRVSLEFCAACHDNASETWKEQRLD